MPAEENADSDFFSSHNVKSAGYIGKRFFVQKTETVELIIEVSFSVYMQKLAIFCAIRRAVLLEIFPL